jgi:hypothetical protein
VVEVEVADAAVVTTNATASTRLLDQLSLDSLEAACNCLSDASLTSPSRTTLSVQGKFGDPVPRASPILGWTLPARIWWATAVLAKGNRRFKLRVDVTCSAHEHMV